MVKATEIPLRRIHWSLKRIIVIEEDFLKFPDTRGVIIITAVPYCRKYRPSSSTMLALQVISKSIPKVILLVSGKLMRKTLPLHFIRNFWQSS